MADTVDTVADPVRRRSVLRFAIVGGGLLVAANVLVFAGLANDETDGPKLPAQIEALLPNPQEVIRPQETVGADLRDDLQGELKINGAPVPRDQLTGDPSLGLVTFRPGCFGATDRSPGAECLFREFDPGTYNLEVEYWPRTKTIEEARQSNDVRSYGWQIKVG